MTIAKYLSDRDDVTRVLYPGLSSHPQHALAKKQMSGFGTVVCLDLNEDKERAFKFMNALNLIDISNNLGDAKSIVTHPATTTHQRISAEDRTHLGISDGFIRLSVGLEDVRDLEEDIDQALSQSI